MVDVKDIMKARREGDIDKVLSLEHQREREKLASAIDHVSLSNVREFTKLIEDYARMEGWIKSLQEENKKLRDENYKDEQLQEMKQRLEEMRSDLHRGFTISESEDKALKQWVDNHEQKHKGGHGCCGGKYTYIFIPTSIGTIGTIKCGCGESFDFQEI